MGGGGGGGGGTRKKLQDATHEELMSLVKHHSARLKIVEEEYGKLKQKVGGRMPVMARGCRRVRARAQNMSLTYLSATLRVLVLRINGAWLCCARATLFVFLFGFSPIGRVLFFFFFSSSGGWGKIKL